MGKKYHFCQDLRGPLQTWSDKNWEDLIAKPNKVSIHEAKDFFLDRIAEGKKVIPIGEKCDGFSYETGCPGHEEEKK